MKRFLFIVSLSVVAIICQGQSRYVTYGEPDKAEILHVLDYLGFEFYNLKLPVDDSQAYNVEMIVDEYEKGEPVNQIVHRLPETYCETIYPGETEITYERYDEISVILNSGGLRGKPNIMFIIPDAGSGGFPINIKEEHIRYLSRPFELQAFETDKKIPYIMLGAMWYDERANLHRFCGSNEVDAAMEDELFVLSPHYYIVSLRFTENNDGVINYN